MRLKRIVISFILLLTYTYGFAHNLVPHDGGDNALYFSSISANHEVQGHEHHHHFSNEYISPEHNHVSHAHHYDEGFYEFLVCLLSDVEHSESDYYLQYFPNSNKRDLTENQIKIVAIVAVQFGFEPLKTNLVGHELFYLNDFISPPLIINQLRGPPSISC